VSRYAADTSVDSGRTRDEIERTLVRYGASGFMYGWQDERAVVAFTAHNRQIRFTLPMPDRQDRAFTHTPNRGLRRSVDQVEQQYEQAIRQRWRALLLIVKAKLEAVEAGITTFQDEFLALTVLANNTTVSDWLQPQIEQAYERGEMPELMPQPRPAIEAAIEAEIVS
jgi:hypothetical protein